MSGRKKSNKDNQHFYYETLAGRFLGSKAREHLIAKELLRIKSSQSFLDVGCAQGYYISIAKTRTSNLFGIDYVPAFVAEAKKTGAKVVACSAEKLPFESNKFDFVLCTETLEHVSDWKKAVSEIKRVLKKNGRAIITVPLEKSFFWSLFSIIFNPKKTRGHLHLLTCNDIEKEFSLLKLEKKIFVQSMSETANKVIPQHEAVSMYCLFVFRK